MKWCIFGIICMLFPYFASANISISEIAWMGSDVSASHEWIELHNDGASEDVTGWVLTDDTNLSIELSGSIMGDSYAVLERTTDESVEGGAFLIYTGALVNTGATLKLLRADGSLVDQVSGGEGWENVGGDNVTKETAQYTTSGWVTADSTPGNGLDWIEEKESDEEVGSKATTKHSDSSKRAKPLPSDTVKLVLPDVSLVLDVDAQEVGYVNQPILFSAKPSGIGSVLINSLKYEWNFGDGITSNQKEPVHIFSYPGTYVVTVYAGYKRQERVTRHEITILPVTISLTTNKAGDIQINNDSPYEIDISKYRLRSQELFEFPPRSILLPNQTITIGKKRLGDTSNSIVGFYDTEGVLLDSIIPNGLMVDNHLLAEEVYIPSPQISSLSTSRQSVAISESDFGFSSAESSKVNKVVPDSDIDNNDPSQQLASVSDTNLGKSQQWNYIALAGVLLLGTLGVYATPRRKEEV